MPFDWPELKTRQLKMFIEAKNGCETPLPHEDHGYAIHKAQILIGELLHQMKRSHFINGSASEYRDF